jgi:hypothetical protein
MSRSAVPQKARIFYAAYALIKRRFDASRGFHMPAGSLPASRFRGLMRLDNTTLPLCHNLVTQLHKRTPNCKKKQR